MKKKTGKPEYLGKKPLRVENITSIGMPVFSSSPPHKTRYLLVRMEPSNRLVILNVGKKSNIFSRKVQKIPQSLRR